MQSKPLGKRVFSGIQPTGIPHLGNYLGAIRHWVDMQQGNECIFCLVDMHAITVWQDPIQLRSQIIEQAAILMAAGIDPQKHILFNQSAVSAHARMGWIFNCVARIGWMNRMTQFKDKAGKNREAHSAGLYVYPNLMAADILTYQATCVPVGEDQRQHLELTNDIAQKFNHDYQIDFFQEVQGLIPATSARVMNLRDGSKKMSKSDPSEQGRIELLDEDDVIANKIRRAKSDSEPLPSEVEGLENRLEASNLVSIYAVMANQSVDQVLRQFGGQGFSGFKSELADALIQHIRPIREETKRLLADEAHIREMLRMGAKKASAIAEPIVSKVEEIVGFIK
ncbi:tryptophan--tRNA ligase [Commensalibacter oyaizuii]|uniref:Tryptophan--tRNA ligase n=1 Tax=Commensalibacter oyaizuii TaxID=3043873 RepID=A0ABT6Q155_9PROT|nr:tryptophan--tRNA ligase [Commensalibacter sp. TBRC 16381]MDI2090819.1 tryptophan--tRNA ligase [Commensalibacter sp. TBRC 16381]